MKAQGLRRLLLTLSIATVLAILSAGAVWADGPSEKEVRDIAAKLVCPVCEGQSVAESSAPLSVQMRDVIRKKLSEGESREDILSYFVDRYGESILGEPPKSGFNHILWWLPTLLLVGGVGIVALMLHHWRISQPHISSQDADELTADAAEYRARLEKELGERF